MRVYARVRVRGEEFVNFISFIIITIAIGNIFGIKEFIVIMAFLQWVNPCAEVKFKLPDSNSRYCLG